MSKLPTVIVLTLWTSAAVASGGAAIDDGYRVTINASHSTINDEGDRPYSVFGQDSSLGENWTLNTKYHFSPVYSEQWPLAEAAFVSRSNFIYGQATRRQIGRVGIASDRPLPLNGAPTGAPSWGDRRQTVKVNSVAAGGQYFVPGSGIYVAGEVEHSRTLFGETGIAEDRRDLNWMAAAGVIPVDGFLIAAVTGHDANTDFWGIGVKYLWLAAGGKYVNLEANSFHSRFFDRAAVAMDYYLSPSFSLGGGYARAHFSGQASEDEYTLRGRKFYADTFSVGVSYSKSRYANNLTLEFSYRL